VVMGWSNLFYWIPGLRVDPGIAAAELLALCRSNESLALIHGGIRVSGSVLRTGPPA